MLPVPTPDVLPLPAPAIVFKILLVVTFLLHVIPMNGVLGGNLVVFGSLLAGRNKPDSHAARMGRDLSRVLPIFISWAITFGIAPLLFVQVIYGQTFFPSTILIGWYWYALIPLLIIGYYGVYLLRENWDRLGGKAPFLSLGVSLFFLFIGWLWATNLALNHRPDTWMQHYLDHPAGTHLLIPDPMLIPRYLHFLVGATAVSGIIVAVMGWIKQRSEPEYGGAVIKMGSHIFLGATGVQVAVGIWFLLSLPSEKMWLFLGKDLVASGLFGLALVGGIAALGLFFMAASKRSGKLVGAGVGAISVTLSSMLVMRQLLRQAYLEPEVVDVSAMPMEPQWLVIVIFLALFVWGIVYIARLLALYVGSFKASKAEEVS